MYTVFMLVTATEAWLRLSRDARAALARTHLFEPLRRHPGLRLRLYDAEVFTAVCSDVLVFEADDMKDYYRFVETLRDGPFFTVPYFRLQNVIPAIENGFTDYEAWLAGGGQ